MKNTITMVACIATFLLTWTCMGLIGSYLCECTIREAIASQGSMMLMFIFGWIPTTIVGIDVRNKIDKSK